MVDTIEGRTRPVEATTKAHASEEKFVTNGLGAESFTDIRIGSNGSRKNGHRREDDDRNAWSANFWYGKKYDTPLTEEVVRLSLSHRQTYRLLMRMEDQGTDAITWNLVESIRSIYEFSDGSIIEDYHDLWEN